MAGRSHKYADFNVGLQSVHEQPRRTGEVRHDLCVQPIRCMGSRSIGDTTANGWRFEGHSNDNTI